MSVQLIFIKKANFNIFILNETYIKCLFLNSSEAVFKQVYCLPEFTQKGANCYHIPRLFDLFSY